MAVCRLAASPLVRGAAAKTPVPVGRPSPRTVLRSGAGLPSPLCAPPGARAALAPRPRVARRQGRRRPAQGVRYAHSGGIAASLIGPTRPPTDRALPSDAAHTRGCLVTPTAPRRLCGTMVPSPQGPPLFRPRPRRPGARRGAAPPAPPAGPPPPCFSLHLIPFISTQRFHYQRVAPILQLHVFRGGRAQYGVICAESQAFALVFHVLLR